MEAMVTNANGMLQYRLYVFLLRMQFVTHPFMNIILGLPFQMHTRVNKITVTRGMDSQSAEHVSTRSAADSNQPVDCDVRS
jgi:hypothetical protein